MSFPKNNICVMFLDIPSIKSFNLSPLLYLPFKKSKRFFKHFSGPSRKRYLYIRSCSLPLQIQQALLPLFNEMSNKLFSIINPNIDIFEQFDLSELQKCMHRSLQKQQLMRWKKIIQKTTKWTENHPVYGKYLIVCSFLLNNSFSENDLKIQLRLKSI
jgi:hypothetical protein